MKNTFNRVMRSVCQIGMSALILAFMATPTYAATIHVTSNNADPLTDVAHTPYYPTDPTNSETDITLREAIKLINGIIPLSDFNPFECDNIEEASFNGNECQLDSGTIGTGGDTIVFNFTEQTVITPGSNLDPITVEFTMIDGNGLVAIDGSNISALPDSWGLRLEEANATQLEGIMFQNFDGVNNKGLQIINTTNAEIGGGGATNDLTRANYFVDNTYGIHIEGGGQDNIFTNNFIGNNGSSADGNEFGIALIDTIENQIGSMNGPNVIGGNEVDILITGSSENNDIFNNFMNSVPAAPETSFVTGDYGIQMTGNTTNNTVEENLFAGYKEAAVSMNGSGVTNNVVRLNTIVHLGSNAKGIELLNGANAGVLAPVITFATNNIVQGTVASGTPDGSLVDIYISNSPEEAAEFHATATVTAETFEILDNQLPEIRPYVTANLTEITATGDQYSSELTSYLNDSDNDGLTDISENIWGTDINNVDSDGDGIIDGDEDLNSDGTLNAGESDPTDP